MEIAINIINACKKIYDLVELAKKNDKVVAVLQVRVASVACAVNSIVAGIATDATRKAMQMGACDRLLSALLDANALVQNIIDANKSFVGKVMLFGFAGSKKAELEELD